MLVFTIAGQPCQAIGSGTCPLNNMYQISQETQHFTLERERGGERERGRERESCVCVIILQWLGAIEICYVYGLRYFSTQVEISHIWGEREREREK